jgi:hypothetical protein
MIRWGTPLAKYISMGVLSSSNKSSILLAFL